MSSADTKFGGRSVWPRQMSGRAGCWHFVPRPAAADDRAPKGNRVVRRGGCPAPISFLQGLGMVQLCGAQSVKQWGLFPARPAPHLPSRQARRESWLGQRELQEPGGLWGAWAGAAYPPYILLLLRLPCSPGGQPCGISRGRAAVHHGLCSVGGQLSSELGSEGSEALRHHCGWLVLVSISIAQQALATRPSHRDGPPGAAAHPSTMPDTT